MEVTTPTVEDDVVGAGTIRLGSEEVVAENDSELTVAGSDLFTSSALVGVLDSVDEAFLKQEQALDNLEAGNTEIELGKVCFVFAIS
jgi:hypothetical protein